MAGRSLLEGRLMHAGASHSVSAGPQIQAKDAMRRFISCKESNPSGFFLKQIPEKTADPAALRS